jgi:two-component sensor histidine kinase
MSKRSGSETTPREHQLLSRVREVETLLREVHHRVKGNLQVVASLLTMQAGAATDPIVRQSLEEAATRVSTVALVHADLSESATLAAVDPSTFIRRLVVNVQQIFGEAGAAVSVGLSLDDFHCPSSSRRRAH